MKEKYLADRKILTDEAQILINEGKMEAFEAKTKEIETLDTTFENASKAQANLNALAGKAPINNGLMQGGQTMSNDIIVPTYEDTTGTKEYRAAFMNFCKTGAVDVKMLNLDTQTTIAEAGALIPVTIMKELLQKMTAYGQIFARVRKLNVKGGVNFPILSLKPTASWITETTPTERGKVTANTSLSFSYFGLECKIAISLLAETVTLDGFENTVVDLILEAMIKACETSVIKGVGTTEPLGILNDVRVPAAQIITLTAADVGDWGSWKKKVFAKLPLAYRSGGIWVMASGTFEGYIDGMQDANGRPMARVDYGTADAPQERFGGREVVLVEDDIIAPYETAGVGDVFALFFKPSDYGFNTNMQLRMFRWFDNDKNQYVDKAILIADGKLIDANGVVIVKKGA